MLCAFIEYNYIQPVIRFLIHCLLLFVTIPITSQSLVRNGDMESHTEFEDGFTPAYWNIDHLRDWQSSGWDMSSYCFLDLEKRTDTLFRVTWCCGNTINPHSGKGMVKLSYIKSCPFEPPYGCNSYIHSRLSKPLEAGTVYEISMWVYFPKDLNEDPAIFTNIGFYLSLTPEHLDYHEMLKTDYFFGDTIQKEGWFEIKHYIRALCPLQHLTIGAFRDLNFPSINRKIENLVVYFIDDVKIVAIPEESVPAAVSPTPFCNYFERRKKEEEIKKVDKVNIYFKPNESSLDKEDLKRLDSFYVRKEGNQGRAFVLSGFTDNEGTDNVQLSKDRVQSVRNYYDSTYQLADEMIICFGKGVDTLGDNGNEKGKQINRRVTIQNSDITALQALYRKGLEYTIENKIPEAARTFKAWIQAAPMDIKMSILHDPRLDPLRKLGVWGYLSAEVRKAYNVYTQPGNAFFLDSMYYVDQRYRTYIPFNLTWYLPGLDTFNFNQLNKGWDFITSIDSINLVTIKKYLGKNEFPKISQVGRKPARTVPFVLLHNSDTTLMKTYLPVVKENCLTGNAEWEIYATMFDRLKLYQGLPQHYGTQFTYKDTEKTQLTLYNLDSIDAVNARRRSIGMSAILDPKEIVHVRHY